MISDLDLAKLCMATYTASAPSLPLSAPGGAYVCLTRIPDGVVCAFRGSVTLEDWLHDFLFAPVITREHPQLGFCHGEFLDDAEGIVNAIIEEVGDNPAILTGHSKGGVDAVGVGALMTLAGKPPAKIATFGAPRFGMGKFVGVLTAVEDLPQYRRGNDIVPEVPYDVPPLLCFLDARAPLIEIGVAQLEFLKCHSIAGYCTDIAALGMGQNK